jgi:hypothetical protein
MSDFGPGDYWSRSLSKDLEICDRRVYYRVFGTWGGWTDRAEPEARFLYLLKQAKSVEAFGGTLFHDAVKKILQRIRGKLPVADKSVLMRRLAEAYDEAIDYSVKGLWRDVKPKKATLILIEHVTGADLAENRVEENKANVVAAMGAFLDHHLPKLVAAGPENWLWVDTTEAVAHRGRWLFMAPDLVVRDGDGYVIDDWKTGRHTDTEQLAAYALWLVLRSKAKGTIIPPEKIRGRSIPLLDVASTAEIQFSQADLDRAQARIDADLDRLQDMRTPGLALEKGPFRRTVHKGFCEHCDFRVHCEEDV